ncbi:MULTISPECIES: hypothetical protein [unclassified Wenzhouxiangella]|uniref:hypothetical protein n=1 Tax=unclassified Wenzhouxiangella TaxID=2613841 RepID=UPI000E3287CF|nr:MULTISPECIES: hypothetical protein [unclassified Wenzhouxiangella]RFF27212.1 hypothetical protein DZK25_09555 [Wenzhouxiangella sp. 15181]RFP69102.1 hypothetical protein DZK26_04840 [Wenzhouxiangella sp. 15190]
MSRKKKSKFGDQFEKTLSDEKREVGERFERADVALSGSSSDRADEREKQISSGSTVVRDAFSMPDEDYQLIEAIRQRLIKEHALVRNKSEVLRAGLRVLSEMSSEELLSALEEVRVLKPGRKPQR